MKYLIYIALVAVGLLLGWFFFGNSIKPNQNNHNHTLETENQLWTCSMHPQIKQNSFGKCPICGMDLVKITVNNLASNQFKLTKNAIALANIETSLVASSTHNSLELVLSGKIVENEKTTAVQTSYFSGRIEKLYINSTGEKVTKGQLLALIYSPDLVTAQQELLSALTLKQSQPNIYNSVKNKLKLWKLSNHQIEEIEQSQTVITNFKIYATVSGVVSEKLIEEGSYVKEGSPLLKISNLETVWANFDVYEKQLPFVKKGSKITVVNNTNNSLSVNSEISFINPTTNLSTRTTIARAQLTNPNGIFKPGMFVKGTINFNTQTNESEILSIPKTAILWTGKRSIIYVKIPNEEPIFEMREVTLGNDLGDKYEILEGLNVTDEIVTNGTFTIDAAAQLQGKKSMMLLNESLQKSDKNTDTSAHKVLASKQLKQEFAFVLKKYLQLKNTLVNDDSIAAKNNALELLKSIQKTNKIIMENENYKTYWLPLLKKLNKNTTEISNTNSLIVQRNKFITLSNLMLQSLNSIEVNQQIFVQFCPMANSNNGAIWLSEKAEILNPYYGSAMLTCGNVQHIINGNETNTN